MATANMTIRIDPDLRREAEAVLGAMGLTMSAAVNVLARELIRTHVFPFTISCRNTPNQDTLDAIAETEALLADPNMKRYGSFREILEELDHEENL